MVSVDLARGLHDAGLEWVPAEGDRFVIPDRDLEDHVFTVSEMVIEVRKLKGAQRIMFNGAVEWALDSIKQHEVIWLPSETQLRNRLGRAFRSLRRTDAGYECELIVDGRQRTYRPPEPSDSYALALLDILDDPDAMMRLIVDDS